jgi:hypothetical protein
MCLPFALAPMTITVAFASGRTSEAPGVLGGGPPSVTTTPATLYARRGGG